MAKLLLNVTCGPNDPTRAALAFLVGKAAQDEGHSVSLFLAGDAVQLLRDPVLDQLAGLGTGSLKEHFDALLAGGARFYVSGMSAKSRGLSDADVAQKSAEFAMPKVLVKLTLEHDRVLSY